MQESINKKRFILLAILTALTLVAWWWIQPENRLEVDADKFRVEDLGTVSKVELRSDTSLVKLEFNGVKWRVNDRYDADGNMIRVLFATLQQAQPQRPVSGSIQDSVFQSILGDGVKVSLYAGDALRKEFYAGGNAGKTRAMFADPDTKEVYVMTIPGYRVYVSGILELGVDGWRDKFVFGFNWRNFQRLEVRYPKRPAENFTVQMMKDFFGIPGVDADTARLNTFLDDVSLLTVEEYVSEPKLTDSLKTIQHEMEIIVTDVADRAYKLRLYHPGNSQDGYGLIQDSQTALINRRKIQSVLRPKSYFMRK